MGWYKIRVLGALLPQGLSPAPFWLLYALLGCAVLLAHPARAADYFVNDSSTLNDVFTAAPGAATNSGTTANDPALSLQDILDAYTLTGGDTVFVDAGTYLPAQTLTVTTNDQGLSAGSVLAIRGAGTNTVIDSSAPGSSHALHIHGADFVRVEQMRFRYGNQGVRIENADSVTVADCQVERNTVGVVLTGGGNHGIENCLIYSNSQQGVLGSSSAAPVITGNEIYANRGTSASDHGIELFSCASAEISGNTLYLNGERGIYVRSSGSAVISANTVLEHPISGIELSSSSLADVRNNVVRHAARGLRAENSGGLVLDGNSLYSNTNEGAWVKSGTFQARHNLFYANGTVGLDTDSTGASIIENNTFYRNGSIGLRLWGSYANAEVRNNLFSADGRGQVCMQVADLEATWLSDYNNFHATGGSFVWNWAGNRYSLGSWQHYTDQDRHSLDIDPLLVDPDGADDVLGGLGGADDDFHLQSTVASYHGGAWTPDAGHSLCIDAGDPATAVGLEPVENGGRINLGAYGGTDEASRSAADRRIELLFPNEGRAHFRRIRARWATAGPWTTNDQIKIEYSANGGGSWTPAPNANPLLHNNGLYGWDISAVVPGTQYLVRVVYLADTNIADASDGPFTILDAAPKVIHVNDGSLAGDQWSAAPGAFTNSGLSTNDPLESFQSVIDYYPEIGGGDEVRIDTGVYDHNTTIFLNDSNSGQPGSNLVIRGSAAGAAVLKRGDINYAGMLLKGIDYVRLESLHSVGGRYGVELAGLSSDRMRGLEILNCAFYSNSVRGLSMTEVTNALVSGNLCYTNGAAGIYTFQFTGTLRSNTCHANQYGIDLNSSSGPVEQNTVYSNASYGLTANGNVLLIRENEAYGNGSGISMSAGNSEAVSNRIYRNSGTGLSVYNPSQAHRNTIYSNGGAGLYAGDPGGQRLHHNLLYSNGTASVGYNLYAVSSTFVVEHNTMVGGSGLYIHGPFQVTNRNNIIHAAGMGQVVIRVENLPAGPANFVSDYNDYYATDGASVGYWLGTRSTLESWQQVSTRDPNSLTIDPRFVGPPTNYHLQSTAGSYKGEPFTAPAGGVFTVDTNLSFCIDAGQPASAFGNEPPDNGGRVNIGAFGNSADASLSPGSPAILLTQPNGNIEWFGVQTVTWITRGPWLTNDTVLLEYSDDGGGSWNLITNGLAFASGSYAWDTTGVTPGTNFLLRVSRTGDAPTADASDAAFTVSASGPRTYYVNDTNTVDDLFTTAGGSDANDGLTPATPKATVQSVLDTYNLEGGDTVKIDTGYYPLSATIIVTTNDAGESDNPLLFLGSTNGAGTVIDRLDSGNDVIFFQGTDYLRFESLRLTGGRRGIHASGSSADPCLSIGVVSCVLYTNRDEQIRMTYAHGAEVGACVVRGGPTFSDGISLDSCENILVTGNLVFANKKAGIRARRSGLIKGNELHSNGWDGLSASSFGSTNSLTVEENVCYENGSGMQLFYPGTEGLRNRIFRNRSTGVSLSSGAMIRQNVIYSNGDEGISTLGQNGERILNNLVYLNDTNNGSRFNIDVSYKPGSGYVANYARIENNTIYGKNGVFIGNPVAVTNRHNIIWASGTNSIALKIAEAAALYSDFNDFYVTDGATIGFWLGTQRDLADWQFATKQDANGFSVDPLFVDIDGADNLLGGANGWDDNFHLGSVAGSYTGAAFTAVSTNGFLADATTSPCVDAGDPTLTVADELVPNGGRLNLGAFGGTADASLSPEIRRLSFNSHEQGSVLRGVSRVQWLTRGPWLSGDRVGLEYSDNAGTSWSPILGAESVAFEQGYYDWDASAMTPGSLYQLRAARNGEPAV